ncbi:MAG: hypothetical protein LBC95_02945 [Candidatus Nomurabacteria bacterium]|jgi:hypothetical protein|nr:hypothetical protein [Candidatus Nomurabacteria bacterium]
MKISRRGLLLIGLVGALLLLLALHLLFRTIEYDDWDHFELAGLFDMDSEISLATWYSTTILLFVPAVLLFYVGWQKRRAGEKFTWSWFLASAVFLFLSIDDAAMIHEKFSTINRLIGVQDWLNTVNSSLFAWSWWVIYLPVVLALAIVLGKWYLRLPRRTKILVASAVFLAIAGQVGMEIISSYTTLDSGEYIGPVWRGLQKFVGRLGLSLFLFAVVDYIWSDPGLTRVKCQSPQEIQR